MSHCSQNYRGDERSDPDEAIGRRLPQALRAHEEVDGRQQQGKERHPSGAVAGALELLFVKKAQPAIYQKRNEPRELRQEFVVFVRVLKLEAEDCDIDEHICNWCDGERPNQAVVDVVCGNGWRGILELHAYFRGSQRLPVGQAFTPDRRFSIDRLVCQEFA